MENERQAQQENEAEERAKEAAEKAAQDEAARAQAALQEEEKAKVQEEKARQAEAELVRKRAAAIEADAKNGKVAKVEVEVDVCEIAVPRCILKLRATTSEKHSLILKSSEGANKKVSKNCVLLEFVNGGSCSRKAGSIFPYELDAKTKVYYAPTGLPAKIQTLAATLADNPACKQVYAFEEFASEKDHKLVSDGSQRGLVPNEADNPITKAIQTAAGLKQTSVLWRMRMRKSTLEPQGLVVVLNAERVLPGKGEIEFE